MKADLHFHTISENPTVIEGYTVNWEYTNHPGATVAYKVNVDGKQIVWMPDNEFAQGFLGHPNLLSADSRHVAPYLALVEFLRDTDLLIGEAQYLNEEYPKKIGWGHSSLSNACALMKLAGVRRWIVTHHDPMHNDRFLEQKLALTRQLLHELEYPMEVAHAYDGMLGFLRTY